MQEANREISQDKRVEIKINATPKGSFLVDLAIATYPAVGTTTPMLFAKDAVTYVSTLIKTVTGLYNIHKFFNGEKPKAVESVDSSVRIENNNGDVTYFDNRVYNIYQNSKSIRHSLISEFETLDSDTKVTAFELLNEKDEALVNIPRNQFISLTTSETFVSPQEKDVIKTGILSIVTLSFEQKKKWELVYEGNKITAKMSEDFYQTIDKGEKFAKGDQLEAELEIRQEFDDTVNAYINKTYNIVKIIKHIPRAEQGGLFTKK